MGIFKKVKSLFNKPKPEELKLPDVSKKLFTGLEITATADDHSYPEPTFPFDIGKMDFNKKEDIEISDERLKFLLTFLIGRNARTPGIARYWTIDYNINFNEVIQKYLSGGYLEIKYDLNKEFDAHKVDSLKSLLKEKGLKSTGKRQEMIDRLKSNLSEDELYSFFGGKHQFFIGTEKSESILADYKAGLLVSHPDRRFNPKQDTSHMTKDEKNTFDVNHAAYLSANGDVTGAIKLYDQLISKRFDGSAPYTELANIYKKQGETDNLKRTLSLAIDVFERDVDPNRPDRQTKLDRFKKELSLITDK